MHVNAEARETPHVDLPSRRQYERAISKWWSGGGTTTLLIDTLRRRAANLDEAEAVAERLSGRVEAGLQFVSSERIEEQLEMVRAAAAWRQGRERGPNTEFDTFKCLFGDGVQCVQCTKLLGESVVHGPLAGLTAQDVGMS